MEEGEAGDERSRSVRRRRASSATVTACVLDAPASSGMLLSFVPAGSAARPPAGLFFCGFRSD